MDTKFNIKARLIGYDLNPQTVTPGQAVSLSLYWQGEAGFERSWAIFAHIIDAEKKIWGQQDQLPVGGTVLTTSWIKDEYITDSRQILLAENIPPGTYFIEIGLYDPHTFERVPLKDGKDAVMLDTPLIVND